MKSLTGFVLMFLFVAGSAFTQTSDKLSDKEMTQYASVLKQMRSFNKETQEEMMSVITGAGLEVPRFNVLYRAQQNPGQESDATEEEMKQFDSAMKGIDKIQEKSQKKIDAEVEKSGLTLDRYDEINLILQNNPELQQKIIKMIQEK